jgi:hypothetical protein
VPLRRGARKAVTRRPAVLRSGERSGSTSARPAAGWRPRGEARIAAAAFMVSGLTSGSRRSGRAAPTPAQRSRLRPAAAGRGQTMSWRRSSRARRARARARARACCTRRAARAVSSDDDHVTAGPDVGGEEQTGQHGDDRRGGVAPPGHRDGAAEREARHDVGRQPDHEAGDTAPDKATEVCSVASSRRRRALRGLWRLLTSRKCAAAGPRHRG